jgi:hypothetical protein
MVLGGIVWSGCLLELEWFCLLEWRAYLQDTGTRPILAIRGKSTHDYKAVALALAAGVDCHDREAWRVVRSRLRAVLALSSNCVQESYTCR